MNKNEFGDKELYPFIGVGNITFGLSRNNIRQLLKNGHREFTRNEFSENSSDFYEEWSLFIDYDKNNLCQAFEFARPNTLIQEGKNLFDFGFEELTKKYVAKEKDIEDEDHIVYYDLGFGLSRKPFSSEIESIVVFSKSYWLQNSRS